MREPARPASAGGRGPALHHHRHEDRHRPRADRRSGGEHRPAGPGAQSRAAAQAVHRPAADGGAGASHGQGEPGRVRDARHGAGAPGLRGGRGGGRSQGTDLPRAADLHDGGRAHHSPGHSPHPRLPVHGASRRPRDEHRRDGDLHGRGEDGQAHARVNSSGASTAPRGTSSMYTVHVSADRHYQLQSDEANRRIDALLEHLRVPEGTWRLYGEMLTTVLKMFEDGAGVGDLKIAHMALKEMRYGFKVFAAYRQVPKVTVFGSARTPPDHPVSAQAYGFGRRMTDAGWMVITGAGSGGMGAAQEGAGRERSFGLNIRLPSEQEANPWIADDPKLISFKYFFTRKLFLVREAHAMALFPGGFGTCDEAFEALTLIQTGKQPVLPLVLVDEPGGTYWKSFEEFIRGEMAPRGMISADDAGLFRMTDDLDEAVAEIQGFYRVYHSQR